MFRIVKTSSRICQRPPGVSARRFRSREEALSFLRERVGPSEIHEIGRLGWVRTNLSPDHALQDLAASLLAGERYVTDDDGFQLGGGRQRARDEAPLVEAEPLVEQRADEIISCTLGIVVHWSPLVVDLQVEVPLP